MQSLPPTQSKNSAPEWRANTDTATWKLWRDKLQLFDTFDRHQFAKEEREGSQLKRRFFAFVQPRGRILDLGCGTGFNRRFLTEPHAYVGVDPLRLKAAHSYRFPFVVGMAEYLPFRPNSFDSAICIATLDHVGDPAMVISESFRVLRPGGVLGVMNKGEIEGGRLTRCWLYLRLALRKIAYGNIAGLKRGLREVLAGQEDHFHMHHFDRDSLRALCSACFQDVDTRLIGNALFLRAIKPQIV